MTPADWRGINGQPGIADQMVRWYPRVAGHLRRIELAVQSANWVRRYEDECGNAREPTPREQAYLDATAGIWRRLRMDRMRNRTGWGTRKQLFGTSFLWRHVYGWFTGERSWFDRADASDPWDLEVYPVHPSVHDRWDYPNGCLLGVSLRSQDFAGYLSAERMVHMPWHPEDGPEGRTELRALYFDIEALAEAKRGWVRRQSLAGGAVVAKVADPSADEDANKAAVLATIESYEQGERGAMYVPRGFDIGVQFPQGNWESPLEYATYTDLEVDHILGSWLATLGLNTGSSALGNQLSVADRDLWISVLREHGQAIGEIEEMIRCDLGFEDIVSPVWTVDETPIVNRADEVARITSAVEAGLLPITPVLQAHVAELLGLPASVASVIMSQTPTDSADTAAVGVEPDRPLEEVAADA